MNRPRDPERFITLHPLPAADDQRLVREVIETKEAWESELFRYLDKQQERKGSLWGLHRQ